MPTSTKTTADILADAGRALFGDEHWRKPLAEALGVKPDTLSAIMRGKMSVPAGMLSDLCLLVRVRANQLESVTADLDGIATKPVVKIVECPICGRKAHKALRDDQWVLNVINPEHSCTEPSIAATATFKCCPHLWAAAQDAGITA